MSEPVVWRYRIKTDDDPPLKWLYWDKQPKFDKAQLEAMEFEPLYAAAPEISEAMVERIARAIHASWRDGMLNQGRFVANERMAWDTLTPRDQELDRAIARAALRAAQGGKNGQN